MSVGPEQAEHRTLGTRIAAARRLDALADARLSGAIDDVALAEGDRLDERTRLTLGRMLTSVVEGIETGLRRHAARVLSDNGAVAQAEQLLKSDDDVVRRLSRAGLLRDRLLMDELLAQVRSDLTAAALLPTVCAPEQASVLVRLAEVDDHKVAAAASALLSADAGRRNAAEHGRIPDGTLPAERHRQLVWWVAATIRESQVATTGASDAAVDRAIVEAAQHNLAAHDDGQRPDALAVRLATAIDARSDEVGDLLVEALGDRRLSLFIAVLARAVDLDFPGMRTIVLEPEGDRLWLALRAAGLDRPTIARIALALADADPRRDIESFADDLDAIVAIPVETARSALAQLTLHHDLRLAIEALAREAA